MCDGRGVGQKMNVLSCFMFVCELLLIHFSCSCHFISATLPGVNLMTMMMIG